jgi:hypothetical protein
MPVIKENKQDYAVKTKDVLLSVFIGEGQFGRSDVIVDGKQIVRVTGDITELRLGAGDQLKGKELRINTMGVDINTDTNRLRVDYELKGGDGVLSFDSREKVKDNDSVLFLTTVSLT